MGARATTGDPDGKAAGSLRLCAVSRAQKPPDELIRFVLGPDGAIAPDLARRLPGRGIWVDATRETVGAAVRRNVFARSLKQAVSVPGDLPALVERLMARRLGEAISIANKAGLLVAGFAKVGELIAWGKAAVLIHAADGSEDGAGKLDRKFKALVGPDQASEATVRELTGAELDLAIGRSNVVHAAASGGGASQRILQEAKRLRRYRANGTTQPAHATVEKQAQDVDERD
jgi:predicted RNA-binding protein YlxR (DUF448 family)